MNVKGLKGKDVLELFNKYRVFDYIKTTYDALHTTGRDYITGRDRHFPDDSGLVCRPAYATKRIYVIR